MQTKDDAITITRSEDGAKGRYEARVAGRSGVGELTYSRMSASRIVANHTGVDESLRGMGVGTALVERLVADAQDEGLTVVPLCSFVRAQSERHPEWSGVFEA
ncbi:MAG: GNAT family N-acetyltransferase [Woeseiaceae bacterium]